MPILKFKNTNMVFGVLIFGILMLFWVWCLGFSISSTPKVLAAADEDLTERLQGKMLLQVQDKGQIWYVDQNFKRRQLTADNAYGIFEELALGITNADLEKIPAAAEFLDENQDSDGDGYSDQTEAKFGYNIFGAGKAIIDNNLAQRLSGRFLLQVNDKGRVWYVNPDNLKKYEARRDNIMNLFRALALGITNDNLNKITLHTATQPASPVSPTTPYMPPISQPSNNDGSTVLSSAASAIINGSTTQAKNYFTPEMQTAIEYTINFLNAEGRYNLGNIMSGAQLTSSGASEKVYSTTISYGGYTKTINFYVKKQPNGSWLLANL